MAFVDFSQAYLITVDVPFTGTLYYIVGNPKVVGGQRISPGVHPGDNSALFL